MVEPAEHVKVTGPEEVLQEAGLLAVAVADGVEGDVVEFVEVVDDK